MQRQALTIVAVAIRVGGTHGMGICPEKGAHGHESILPPSGKNCPVRGGFRFLGSARRPDPVFNCCQ